MDRRSCSVPRSAPEDRTAQFARPCPVLLRPQAKGITRTPATLRFFEASRRIFTLYVDGMSPRAIARLLNDENVPGPRGRRWVDTTIRGQVARGTGILNNANYAGVLEWGRCEFVKDPGTGKRVARINPQGKREIVEVPELRIIDDVL
ncbi:recombinase family protein, partial [Azospirillum argentinense]|uniref:recombinase family protein n=1 Tax=Azospirillum argentinense TaxID=2970906 RepID=UPI003D815B1D